MIFHIVNTHGQPTTFFFCSSWTQQLSTTFPARLLFCYVSIVFYNICLRKYFRFLYPIHLVFKHKPGIFKQKPFPCFWLTTTNCLVRLGTNLLLTVLLIQLMSLSFLSLFFAVIPLSIIVSSPFSTSCTLKPSMNIVWASSKLFPSFLDIFNCCNRLTIKDYCSTQWCRTSLKKYHLFLNGSQ